MQWPTPIAAQVSRKHTIRLSVGGSVLCNPGPRYLLGVGAGGLRNDIHRKLAKRRAPRRVVAFARRSSISSTSNLSPAKTVRAPRAASTGSNDKRNNLEAVRPQNLQPQPKGPLCSNGLKPMALNRPDNSSNFNPTGTFQT